MQGCTLPGNPNFLWRQRKLQRDIHPLQGLPRIWGGCNTENRSAPSIFLRLSKPGHGLCFLSAGAWRGR